MCDIDGFPKKRRAIELARKLFVSLKTWVTLLQSNMYRQCARSKNNISLSVVKHPSHCRSWWLPRGRWRSVRPAQYPAPKLPVPCTGPNRFSIFQVRKNYISLNTIHMPLWPGNEKKKRAYLKTTIDLSEEVEAAGVPDRKVVIWM